VNEVTHEVKEAARRMVETGKEALHKTNDNDAQAFTDVLTGLRNKAYFDDNAGQELRYCIDENREFNLIMFSIDNLQRISDTHGSDIREEMLKIVSMRARNSFKQGNLLARYSDNEFIVTLPNVRHGTAVKLAEQLQKRMKDAPFAAKGLKVDVSVSVGVAVRTPACKTLQDIVSNAGKALASSAKTGADRLAAVG